MKAPENKPTVQLTGEDGNAFYIMGRVSQALRKAGADKEYIEQYHRECAMGDYNHLLTTTMKYVIVQ